MTALPTFPINYDAHRKALVREVQRISHLICIVEEPETQNAPRPSKPYFSLKFTSPAIKQGDDSTTYVSGTVWNRGGHRNLMVGFNAYGRSHEEAYNYMALWQACLEREDTQSALRSAGISVMLNGNVTDLSQLLNTGYEGRSHMEVRFGIAANLAEDLGAIETVNVTGRVTSDQGNEIDIALIATEP